MDHISPGLAAHKGSRGKVLLDLKRDQPLTAAELAARVGVSTTAVRRHLKELEAEGLVVYGREQRGHGAPTFAFRLTADGETLFPHRYEETVTRLLEHLMANDGKAAALTVIKQQYADLKRRLGELDDLSHGDRLSAVAGVLSEAGFMAQSDESASTLNVCNCAIHAVAECLPETCDVELEFLRNTLGASVHRKTHIVSGSNACEYTVVFDQDEEVGDPASLQELT